jgi:hypothetical protein
MPEWMKERAKGMVKKGVTGGSATQYQGHWRKWLDFLGTIEEENRPDEYLVEVTEEEEKVMFLMGFAWYVSEVLGVKGAKEVSGVVSGVRFQWKKEGMESGFFEDPRVRAAKQGARLTPEQMRSWSRKSREKRKLPICTEMIQWMRDKWYSRSGTDAEGIYCKGVYLAAAIAFDVGLRPSNVRKADGPNREDHCIRAGELVFYVDKEGGEVGISGGESIRDYLGRKDNGEWRVDPKKLTTVMGVGVSVVTSKTSNKVRAPLTEWTIRRGNAYEEALVMDLSEFMVLSGVKEDDPFCSRWAVGRRGVLQRKVVTSADLSKAVKEAAAALGLPTKNFSAKSLRSGFASHMAACGVPQEEFKARAGWSDKSTVPQKHYVHQVVRGAYSLGVDSEGDALGLGLNKLRTLLPRDQSGIMEEEDEGSSQAILGGLH